MYAHILGELDEVVVGDGGFAGAGGTDEEGGDLMGQEQLQEELLSYCLWCLDDQVTQLKHIHMCVVGWLLA